MTRTEYLSRLGAELRRRGVADAEEILGEYAQHFDYKLDDGFSEEEIAARLGAPEELAAQFVSAPDAEKRGGRKAVTVAGLVFADLFAGMFFALHIGLLLALAAFACVSAAVGVSLLGGLNPHGLIPLMPYWCGALFALALLSLAVLAAVGCVYFIAYIRQLLRAYGRFHHNALAAASGRAALPALALHPQLPARRNRRLRTAVLLSLAVFALCFAAAYAASALSAGSFEFWHAWGWFVG